MRTLGDNFFLPEALTGRKKLALLPHGKTVQGKQDPSRISQNLQRKRAISDTKTDNVNVPGFWKVLTWYEIPIY